MMSYYKAVMKVFVKLYEKKLIYRGARMIHWDPAARTALSDEEVEYRDVEGISVLSPVCMLASTDGVYCNRHPTTGNHHG